MQQYTRCVSKPMFWVEAVFFCSVVGYHENSWSISQILAKFPPHRSLLLSLTHQSMGIYILIYGIFLSLTNSFHFLNIRKNHHPLTMTYTCYLCHSSFTSRSKLHSHISSRHRGIEANTPKGEGTVDTRIPSRSRSNSSQPLLPRGGTSRGTSISRLPSNVLSSSAQSRVPLVDFNDYICKVPGCPVNVGYNSKKGYLKHMRTDHPQVKIHPEDVKCRYGCEHYFGQYKYRSRHEKDKHGNETHEGQSVELPTQEGSVRRGQRRGGAPIRSAVNGSSSRHSRIHRPQGSNKMDLRSLLIGGKSGSVAPPDGRKRPRSPPQNTDSSGRRRRTNH